MITLRLFHQSDPFHPIDARRLNEAEELAVGRAVEGGWTIDDPDRALSRRHCVLALQDERLTVRDLSANGVFLGPERQRLPADQPTAIAPGDSLHLGEFVIVVGGPEMSTGSAFDAPFNRPVLQSVAVDRTAVAAPSDWADAAPSAAPPSHGSLLDAFCAGARLDASAFAGEDPVEVMKRLGGVYQQMVLGLADLMNERTSIKSEYRLERTTVGSAGNNPFRWAPPQRVAVDLLRTREDAFLCGPAAVADSFADMKKHLLCMLAGLRATVGATIDGLAPEAAEESLKGQSFLLKNRAGAAWAEYQRLWSEFRRQAEDSSDSAINRAFRDAYEARLRELDALDARP